MPPRQRKIAKDVKGPFRQEEAQAFDFFFRRYYTALCFFANSIIHNEDEARDIVQDCFLKLWSRQATRKKPETIKSFLYTMVRNQCIDVLRKEKTRKRVAVEMQTTSDRDFEYFDEVAFAELMRRIIGYIEELPSKTRQVFRLYYINGMSYTDIACALKTSPETVRKQRQLALKALKGKLLIFLLLFFFF